MSHIVEFSVSGLAGRKDVYSQVLDRHVNVFFGLNGSGKTSLLKILHSAMSGKSGILRNVPFSSAEVKIYSITYDRILTRTIDKQLAGAEKEAEPESEAGVSDVMSSVQEYFALTTAIREGVPETTRFPQWEEEPTIPDRTAGSLSHRYLPTSRLYLGLRTIESQIISSRLGVLSEEVLDRCFAETLKHLWANYYSDVLTAVREAQEDGLASILKAVLSGRKQPKTSVQEIDLKTAYNRVTRFLARQGSPGILGSLEDFEKHYEENEQLRSVVNDIDEIERRIADATSPRDKLQSLIQEMFTGNKEVRFRDKSIDVITYDDENIGLSTLSSGEKHVLRILIESLLARSHSILIDEPELSMHVDWQKNLIRTMRQLNSEAQLILATHSPEIMANLSDDRIFRL